MFVFILNTYVSYDQSTSFCREFCALSGSVGCVMIMWRKWTQMLQTMGPPSMSLYIQDPTDHEIELQTMIKIHHSM